ncbi:DCC1-like thiol-disulfide oxidoreductase family protein [Mucilaginibacter lacusdianchii]|uniref:DCC1-like thiol-disulfide oxidoreductase family protein n=1 Tax=Mucilaginibacter lacusdianchii TaxID=2684211 RepID=UPI00131BA844|nr:DCC1-like thiol-disulfide oxidoreductase family protein [Mucilaginibacter sp. JXJ CY 39]
MSKLKNYLILFDAECPMCKMYTQTLVQAGVLESDGRMAYQSLPADACPMVDRQRAVNEIALVNQQTGEVTYGIHSLFKVIGMAMPVWKPLFAFGPFIWIMSKVYAFISYNRRVIIPATQVEQFQLQPSFKRHYRIAYLMFTWLVTSFILTQYAGLLQGLVPVGNSYREYLICGGQIFFQGYIINLINKEKMWNYLGNMMTISFGGSLLLLPGLLLAGYLGQHPVIYAGYFMLVAGLMFLEHIRRSRLLQLGWAMTISWALYRAAILIIILI